MQDKILEHKRWNAYTRAERYVYGAVKDGIAKTYPDLIHYNELSERAKEKNRIIGAI